MARSIQPGSLARINWANPITQGLVNALVGGLDHVKLVTTGLTQVDNGPFGRTERGAAAPYYPADDINPVTVIGHMKLTSENGDYAAIVSGYFTSNSDNRQVGIGMGPFSPTQIYAVYRLNTGVSILLETPSFPYEAVWAISGYMDNTTSGAKLYKNGILFTTYPAQSSAFAVDSRRNFGKFASTSTGKESAWAYKFNRILSDAEIASLSNDPYQIFLPVRRRVAGAAWLLDTTLTGWTVVGAAGGAGAINEAIASDTEYIRSPMLGASAQAQKFPLLSPMAAGNWTFHLRAAVDYTGSMVVRFLDSGNSSVGATSSQTLSQTLTTYALSVTLTGTATQVQFEPTNP